MGRGKKRSSAWATVKAKRKAIAARMAGPAAASWEFTKHWWGRISTPVPYVDPGRMDEAIEATRSWTLVYALWAFVFGFSVDDLGVLRIPGYMVGIGGAILIFSVGSIIQSRMLIVHNRRLDEDQFEIKMQLRARVGQLMLLITVLGTVAWFVVFSAGVPPWAN